MSPHNGTPTARQATGAFGEQCVTRDCFCPRCKRHKTLVRLPPNFKCVDVVCDFCDYLAQVQIRHGLTVPINWRNQRCADGGLIPSLTAPRALVNNSTLN